VKAASALKAEALGNKNVRVSSNVFLAIAPAVDGGFFEDDQCEPGITGCEVRDDRFDLVDGLSLWTYAEMSIIKPLHTFGKVENYARAAEHNARVKEQDVRLQRGETIADMKRAYYGHLAAKNTTLFLKDVQRRVENSEDLVRNWLDEGEGDVRQSSLYAIVAARELITAYVHQAESLEKISLDGMKVLSGIGLAGTLELRERSLRALPLPEGGLDAYQQQALDNRPEMSQVENGLKARQALVAATKSMQRPNIYAGVSGMYSAAPGRERLDNPYIYDPFNDYGMTPMLGMQWSWEPGVQRARVDGARAELNALIEKQSFARQGIPFQVSEQFYDVHAYFKSQQSLARSAKSARRWMIASYTDFEAGLETTDKLVTAFQAYVLAYGEYLKTVYEYNMKVVRLDVVTGAYE
jgi:outer membrane protein TolC